MLEPQRREPLSSAMPLPADTHRWTAARAVQLLSIIYLIVVVGLLVLVFVISERWWVGSVVTYLPRVAWAAPAIVLTVAAGLWHRPSLWWTVLALGLVAGPLMELRGPGMNVAQPVPQAVSQRLRVVSCNVQAYRPDFADVVREIQQFDPDVVAMQEARGEHPLLLDAFRGWEKLHLDYYWIGSKYPLRLVHECAVESFERTSGILVEVQTPQGPVLLANLHLMTARRGLSNLTKRDLLTGESAVAISDFQMLRAAEAGEVRSAVDAYWSGQPFIAVGDFNTPTSSSLFQQSWSDLRSAFDVAGQGYGYTSPNKPHRYWFSYTPWARIDHILCSQEWSVAHCQIGTSRGSDHRLIAAELVR
jgi:endonuclease/exonuclease/phosphatase (EEP) superfamily protein YafD